MVSGAFSISKMRDGKMRDGRIIVAPEQAKKKHMRQLAVDGIIGRYDSRE